MTVADVTSKFAIHFDPSKPEEFFYEVDKFGIEIIAKSKYLTVARAKEILLSVEDIKREMMVRLEKMKPLDGSKD